MPTPPIRQVTILLVEDNLQDIEKSYALGVNTYIQKPVQFEQFLQVVQAVQDYWIVIGTLPSDENPASP